MKIAYLASYVGKEFTQKYLDGKHYALSGPFKILGISRALLAAGHSVTIFSPGLTVANQHIKPFDEYEDYPEGRLEIKYPRVLSFRKCGIFNDISVSRLIKKLSRQYDCLLYYNIDIAAVLCVKSFKNKIKVLEYEDNIFNKALVGDKNSFEWFKRKLYNRIIANTDGVMAVCNGLMLPEIPHRVLTPGIINEEVINNVTTRVNKLQADRPVHIILTGGIHYSKGGDLLVKAMTHIKTPCVITVYGNCDLNDTMKELIKQVPDCHKFDFKGYMPHEELIKTLDRDADILINTTRSMHVGAQAAGFPFKMMEYASTGRPIVSSEIGKLDEDYNSHITYYDGEDPKAIAAAIEEVIANYDEKVQKALELQKRVLSEYTIEGTGRKLGAFIKEIQKDGTKEK